MIFKKLETGLTLASLMFVSWITHYWIIPVGLAFVTSDSAMYPMTADYFLAGEPHVFQMQDRYGGSALSAVRAIWVWFQGTWDSSSTYYLNAHMQFTHVVVPMLLTLAFYFLMRAYASKKAAFVVGLFAAVGLNYWAFPLSSNEFVYAYLIMGAILLAIRARYENPILEMKWPALFGVSVLAGLAIYTARASIVYVVAFFLPLSWVWTQIKQELKPRDRVDQWIWRGVVVLLALYVYVELFGADLGLFFGRRVKVAGGPNLNYALILLGALWLKNHRQLIQKNIVQRLLLVFFGVLVGFGPELWYWLSRGEAPPLTGGRNYPLDASIMILGRVPSAIRTFFVGGDGIARFAILSLLVLSSVHFVRQFQNAWKPIAISIVMAIFGYARVYIYDVAPYRYLTPIVPGLLVLLALYWDWASQKKWIPLVTALFLLACFDQVYERHLQVERYRQADTIPNMMEVVQTFQGEKVTVVITDDYWTTNGYTLAAQRSPYFTSEHFDFLIPRPAIRLGSIEKRVGILMGFPEQKVKPTQILKETRLSGRDWKLTYLKTVGTLQLYLGEVR